MIPVEGYFSFLLRAAYEDFTKPEYLKTVIEMPFTFFNDNVWGLASIALEVLVVWAGIQRIMAGAEPGKVAKAMGTIQWAVIGFALVMASILIVKLGASLIGYGGGGIGTVNIPNL